MMEYWDTLIDQQNHQPSTPVLNVEQQVKYQNETSLMPHMG